MSRGTRTGPQPRPTARHTSLPTHVNDLIIGGVATPPRGSAFLTGKPVWKALCSTACSAQMRGWSFAEWQAHVLNPRNGLGQQVAAGQAGRQLDRRAAERHLLKAWKSAEAYLSAVSLLEYAEDRRAQVRELEQAIRRLGAPNGLEPGDLEVLLHAVALGELHGSREVRMPWRSVKAGTGLGQTKIQNALRRLREIRALHRVERGVAAKDPRARRAAVYRLPSAAQWERLVSAAPAKAAKSTPAPGRAPLDTNSVLHILPTLSREELMSLIERAEHLLDTAAPKDVAQGAREAAAGRAPGARLGRVPATSAATASDHRRS